MKYTFKDLKNKVVLLTGGSGFFGKQISRAFLENGSKVIILDIKKNQFKSKNLFFYKCNISDEKNLIFASKKIFKRFKKIDVLINNASNNYSPQKKNSNLNFENFDQKLWDSDLKVGLTGAFLCTKIFGKIMSKRKIGNIINISSDLGIISPDQRLYSKFTKPISYSVVKHGIIGLTKYTATYWANKNIRCNSFAPGGIINNQPKNFLNRIKKLIPLNRMAKKNEYNATILFLASDASSYINGATVISDGGRTIW